MPAHRPMRVFVDVDGTLTERQTARSVQRGIPLRHNVIERVKAWAAKGHEIVIWTGSTIGARQVQAILKLPGVVACVGKPHLIVDNQGSFGRKLKRRLVSPEMFVAQPVEEIPDVR